VSSLARILNFSAGPAILPEPVLAQLRDEMLSLPGIGMSVLEISHRSQVFEEILNQTLSDLKTLLGVPEGYHLIFLQGGASLQFSMIPLNFLLPDTTAAYIDSGSWGRKALCEAKREGNTSIVWSGKSENYKRMPSFEEIKLPEQPAYLHITSNETIEGIELFEDWDLGKIPLICDASSDILSRPVDISKYSMIYAGAQKNMGPAGVTLAIIKDDFLAHSKRGLHTMLDYSTYVENNSLYNTPPVFAIRVVGLVARWLLDNGGLKSMAALNQEKANLIYAAIDQSDGFYRGHATPESRSRMNITFRLPNEDLEAQFIQASKEANMDGLKGHRSVGGIRASIYNAFPLNGAKILAEFMRDFARNQG
jgi:phosphoserine aminotransferase